MEVRTKAAEKSILVVDDDRKTVELIRLYLNNEGYQVVGALDGATALQLAREMDPDLIVLDLMLPKMDGLDICQTLRNESDVPMIMVTARTTEEDRLTGLELGADDYITKPFSPRELVARVKAVLRRAGGRFEPAPVQVVGKLVINYDRYEVAVAGEPIRLTPREFNLLAALASHPGRVYSRQELLEQAFGMDFEGLDRTVDVHMMNLRKKIEQDPSNPSYILTIYGVGYKLADDGYGP
ncbi:MAG: response regulator [Anaerolineales bacterium]|jgi:DNA-binding response OmpR family regulator